MTIQIYEGDCLQRMAQMNAGSVDLCADRSRLMALPMRRGTLLSRSMACGPLAADCEAEGRNRSDCQSAVHVSTRYVSPQAVSMRVDLGQGEWSKLCERQQAAAQSS